MRSDMILIVSASGGYLCFRCRECRTTLGMWQMPVDLANLIASAERYEHECLFPTPPLPRDEKGNGR